MSTLLICNVQVVNEGLIQEADVFIRDGRIARIGSNLSHLQSKQFIDGAGKYLMPGMIDSEFRLKDYSLSELQQETKAALAGGITSSLLVPELAPDLFKPSIADISLQNNLSIYYPATHQNHEGIESIDHSHCCGIYVDMVSLNDDHRIDDPKVIENILQSSPTLVAFHAEDAPSILENEESYRQIYGDDVPFQLHSLIRGADACTIAATEVLKVAVKCNARAHFMHLSSVEEIELIGKYRKGSSNISAGVCSHFLVFSDADYVEKGGLLKCQPAIKADIDRAALLQGLLDNNIDLISSGHMPLSLAEKQNLYFDVPAGLPLAQYAFPAILEHFQDQIVSLEFIAEKTSHEVAERFSIQDRGFIREGYWADLVLVDLEGSFIARDEDVISSAGWTIFNGNEFRSSIVKTIVNGKIMWSKGEFTDDFPAGMPLEFTGRT